MPFSHALSLYDAALTQGADPPPAGMAGIDMVHVSYRGGGQALTDLIAGQVQVYFAGTAPSIEYIRAGRLRALAVTAATRSEVLPDIPTVDEFVRGYESSYWAGIGAPGHAGRDRREAQQGDQRGPCRP
jgi:tripartite-type tricarboxylate transporter receptor subunit TctC